LDFNHRVEIGVSLLEALGGLAHFDREAPRVVMRRAALAARSRELVRCLIERGPFICVERDPGDDA